MKKILLTIFLILAFISSSYVKAETQQVPNHQSRIITNDGMFGDGLPDIFHIDNLDYKNDIESLAGIIANCDLVITIPNFTTQLAAAIGVPVFVLLPFSSDWRWFVKRKNSPWYPNIEIFRQKKFGEWKEVIAEVRKKILNNDNI